MVLRYIVAEQNRWLFRNWEYMQIALAALFFCYLLFGTMEGKFSLGSHARDAGPHADAAPVDFTGTGHHRRALWITLRPTSPPQEHARFWLLHNAYLRCEALKFGLGLILGMIVMSCQALSRPLEPVQYDR